MVCVEHVCDLYVCVVYVVRGVGGVMGCDVCAHDVCDVCLQCV